MTTDAAGDSPVDSAVDSAGDAAGDGAEQVDGPGDEPRSGRRRFTEAERGELLERLGGRYREGSSIRQLAGEEGLSYGFVHRLLSESGTPLRGRGGSNRRPRTS